ncbi:S41 family peptidase [Candidatus Saccharibacteria bacterium]|nr:S41 family peptidase [Candidatus Saccharibacteria bacterium]
MSKTKQEWKERKVGLGGAIVCAAITLVAGIGIGIGWNTLKDSFLPYLGFGNNNSSSIDWSPLNEVYSSLVSNYDGEINKTDLIEGAKAGMVDALNDKYSVYMTADEASDFNKSLHGEVGAGIGIVIAERNDYIRVLRTLPDNPARKAGVLAGDIIYKINGEEVYNLDSDIIASKLRGDAGTKVTLTVVRDGEEKSFEMTREEINNVSADITYKDDTAIIMVTRFDNDTGTIVQKAAKEFKDKEINKVILDLRNNGGGYTNAAKDLVSLWIDGETVFTQKSKVAPDSTIYASHNNNILKDMKTIVLVNGNTASASEIVAGALQDYGKAKIVGTKTYGKGVVQSLINLSGNSLLKVTSAHWYTPHGNSIAGTGITPDKEINITYDQINSGEDPQLDYALSH